jgi:hypothetical protein
MIEAFIAERKTVHPAKEYFCMGKGFKELRVLGVE